MRPSTQINKRILIPLFLIIYAVLNSTCVFAGNSIAVSERICTVMRKIQLKYHCALLERKDWGFIIDDGNSYCSIKLFRGINPPYYPSNDWYVDEFNLSSNMDQRAAEIVSTLRLCWRSELFGRYLKVNNVNGQDKDAELVYQESDWDNLPTVTSSNYLDVLDELEERLDQLTKVVLESTFSDCQQVSAKGESNDSLGDAQSIAMDTWNGVTPEPADCLGAFDICKNVDGSFDYSAEIFKAEGKIRVSWCEGIMAGCAASCYVSVKVPPLDGGESFGSYAHLPSVIGNTENWNTLESGFIIDSETVWESDSISTVPSFTKQDVPNNPAAYWAVYGWYMTVSNVCFVVDISNVSEEDGDEIGDDDSIYELYVFKDEKSANTYDVYSANPSCSYQEYGEVVLGNVGILNNSGVYGAIVFVPEYYNTNQMRLDSEGTSNIINGNYSIKLPNNESIHGIAVAYDQCMAPVESPPPPGENLLGDSLYSISLEDYVYTRQFSVQAIKTSMPVRMTLHVIMYAQSEDYTVKRTMQTLYFDIKPNHYDMCCSSSDGYKNIRPVVFDMPILHKMLNGDIQATINYAGESYVLVKDYVNTSLGTDRTIFRPKGFIDFDIVEKNEKTYESRPLENEDPEVFSYEHVVELRYPGSRTIVYIPDSTWDLAPEGTAKPILLLDKNSKPVKEFIYGANDLLIEIRDIQKSRPKRTIAY